ncbi:MAG: hypothetical protein JWO38_6685 [Gemmataceae bacterium]|nr:hypothetical protein [Gemmataceae bacterium]
MTRRMLQIGLCLALGLGTLAATPAADPKSTDTVPKTPAVDKGKAPDFSGYVSVGTVMGEVMAANETSATLRIYWPVAAQPKGRGGRPHLQNNSQTAMNPYSTRRQNIKVKWEHHDYEIPFVPESLVRVKTLPPKTNAEGKKVSYTEKELDEMKVPYSVPGYAASKSDLTKGTVVEAYVIRDKSISADKVTENDMRLRYLIIVGHDPNPPADGGNTKPTKKN